MDLERSIRFLIRASRAALAAQERNCRWEAKGTNSKRVQSIQRQYEAALKTLERAEAEVLEALFQHSIR